MLRFTNISRAWVRHSKSGHSTPIPTARTTHAVAVGTMKLAPSQLRAIMNERFVTQRTLEREGFRRVLAACMLFVGYKFVRHRFFGKVDDKAM